jgi:hypothetical protein
VDVVESSAGAPEPEPPPASAPNEEVREPRMRILDEELPAMRILE